VQPNNKIVNDLRENGYSVVENFLSEDEVEKIKNYLNDIKGYNFHIPNRAFNKIPQKYDENLNWNSCAYKTNQLMHNAQILNLITRPDVIATIQEYLGCLPTITSVSSWWSKYTGETFHTQNLHRDYDDFKFLAFFIYLSDVNEDNGPHIYYANTHNGSDDMSNKKVITGKAGTAIFADTFGLHHGKPLNKGDRLLFWTRYCLHKSNNFYRDYSEKFVQEENMFFDIIEDNSINRHLLHAYIK
jgi:ectoine hydroxylase-related dioxygenase (phytanoyl-CoA dioxygenase family)